MPRRQPKGGSTAARKRTKAPAAALAQPKEQPVLTPAILHVQRETMALAQRLFAESQVCRCRACKSMLLREKAEALVGLVIKVMELTMQKSSGEYMAALRLRAACQASTPTCSGAGGAGWAMPPSEVVYDRCRRTQSVLSTGFTGAASLNSVARR